MAIRVEQTPDMAPGAVRLVRQGPGEISGNIEVSIARIDQGAPRYLDPSQSDAGAWAAGERWFRPENGEGQTFGLSPAATWHLKPHMPYLVRLRDAAGTVIEDRMSWPVIRLPSTAPPPGQTQVIEPEPAPVIDEPDPLDVFADMPVEPVASPPPAPVRSYRWLWWLVPCLLLIALGGVLAYLWMYERELFDDYLSVSEPVAPAAAVPEIPLTLDGARTYLKSKPPAAEAAAQAKRFAHAGQADGSFLILKYAARQGDAGAGESLGDLYNPSTHKPGGVVAQANADQAAVYYMDAAAKPALYKAGQLLKAGKLTDQALKTRVTEALSKAAAAGDAKAKELLP